MTFGNLPPHVFLSPASADSQRGRLLSGAPGILAHARMRHRANAIFDKAVADYLNSPSK